MTTPDEREAALNVVNEEIAALVCEHTRWDRLDPLVARRAELLKVERFTTKYIEDQARWFIYEEGRVIAKADETKEATRILAALIATEGRYL